MSFIELQTGITGYTFYYLLTTVSAFLVYKGHCCTWYIIIIFILDINRIRKMRQMSRCWSVQNIFIDIIGMSTMKSYIYLPLQFPVLMDESWSRRQKDRL